MAHKLTKNVYLIGFMGAGKSSAGRKLARICGCESIDVDSFIERMCDLKIKDIFSDVGEKGFRQIETDALKMISEMKKNVFVSCGGGVVLEKRNVEIMKNSGVVVHLYSDAYNGARRISDLSTRPLFKDVESAQLKFMERLPFYRESSHFSIDTTGKTSSKVVNELIKLLERKQILIKV